MPHPESIYTVKSRKGFQTRSALIEAAFELIADEGVAQLTVASISEAVGLTRSSAYNHFPDLGAVLDGVYGNALNLIGEQSSVTSKSRNASKCRTRERLKFVLQLSSRHPRLAKVISELYLHHNPSVAAIEQRLLSDIHADIVSGHIELSKRESTHFARMAVATAMATLRMRILTPAQRTSSSALLKLLLDPVRPNNG